MWSLTFLAAVGFGCITFAGCADDKNVLDKIFEINQIKEDGQVTFSGMPELFEGDIVKTARLDRDIKEFKEAAKKGISPFDAISRGQWPGGKIPYVFGRGFTGHSVVRAAIADYNRHTCIRFTPRRRERDYVEFFHGGGCYSMIGRQGGRQRISLARPGCLQKGVTIHEMMHAAGFFHEQSRLDRDRYIRIVWGNISPRVQYNFQKYKPGQASALGAAYDKKSVMHYGNYAFSTNGRKTIISLANPNERLGQRSGFSKIDIQQLNSYYGCSKTTKPVTPTGQCSDKYRFCSDLATKWCSHSWVTSNCKKACKRCPTTSSCKDENQYCSRWASANYCRHRTYRGYMSKKCKKSCGLCS